MTKQNNRLSLYQIIRYSDVFSFFKPMFVVPSLGATPN